MAMTDEELDQFEKDLKRNERQFDLQNRALELERQKLGPTRDEEMRAAEKAERDHWAAMRRENDERRTRELANAPAGRYAAIAQRDARAKVAAWDAEAERDRRAAAENDIRKIEADKKAEAARLQGAEAARFAGEANRFAAAEKAMAEKYAANKTLDVEKERSASAIATAEKNAEASAARLAAQDALAYGRMNNARDISEQRIAADKAKADADRASREKIAADKLASDNEKFYAKLNQRDREAYGKLKEQISDRYNNLGLTNEQIESIAREEWMRSSNASAPEKPQASTPESVQTSAVKRTGGWRYGIA